VPGQRLRPGYADLEVTYERVAHVYGMRKKSILHDLLGVFPASMFQDLVIDFLRFPYF
jgi:hypothetical protein